MSEDMIDKAEKAAQRLEEANKKMEELLLRQETVATKILLGGKSEAGNQAPELSKEEKLKMGMKNYFKGGVLEKVLK